jgi:hypothetical protein
MADGITISNNCVDYIKKILPIGSTILEFGSGQGTVWLSEAGYKMYSVENQKEWMDVFPEHTTYINCDILFYDRDNYHPPEMLPWIQELQKGWYDPKQLFPNLPKSYDLILVDGPGSKWGRGGFYKHIDKFDTDVPMIFDDIHRLQDSEVMELVSEYVGRDYELIDEYTGVILGKSN